MTKTRNYTFWSKHISQWQATELSQQQYCEQHNLKPHSFSYHKCTLLNKQNKAEPASMAQPKKSAPSSGFIQLSPPEYVPLPEPLTLHFKNGLLLSGIELKNVQVVKQLAEVLSCINP